MLDAKTAINKSMDMESKYGQADHTTKGIGRMDKYMGKDACFTIMETYILEISQIIYSTDLEFICAPIIPNTSVNLIKTE